jgi:hypothetical protein
MDIEYHNVIESRGHLLGISPSCISCFESTLLPSPRDIGRGIVIEDNNLVKC